MKKLFGIFLTVLLGVTLVACKPEEKPTPGITDADIIAIAKNQLSLGSQEEMANINGDIELPLEVNVSGTKVQVAWVSSKTESIIVREDKGLVVLLETDVEVKLTATLTLNTTKDTKEFNLVVKAKLNGDIKVASIGEFLEKWTVADADKFFEVENELVVIAVSGDGFIVADATGALPFFKGTGAKVGDKGHIVAKGKIPFGTNINFDSGGQFVKNHKTATDAEIKALAKEATIEEIKTVKYDKVTVGEAETEVFNQSKNMGFFKVTGKLVTKNQGGGVNPFLQDVKNSKDELVHYYKYEDHDFYTAIGNSDITKEGVDVYVAIHDYHSGNKEFRVAFYTVDVVLDDQAKAGVDLSTASNLEDLFYENGTLKLTTTDKTAFGSTIEYTLGDDAAHSSIINVETGAVTPGDDLVAVTLKVKATLNGKVAETELVIQTGKPKTITNIADLEDIKDGTVVRIKGTVSGNKYAENFKNGEATITDSTGSALAYRYAEKFKELFKDGDTLDIIGVLGSYKENKQMTNIAYVVKVA